MGFFQASAVHEECDKGAQVLKKFMDKGRIPKEAVTNAKGIAVFTGFRAGMYLAGAGGSGVVVARLPDGTWSPPSAFSVRSGGIGLVYGVDMYDCVCLLNTQAAVDAYTKPEMKMGGAVALAAGPVGGNLNVGDVKPVWTYTKSKGIYGGVTVDGTMIKERPDANAAFYGSKVTAEQILKGNVEAQQEATKWPAGASRLYEVIKTAEGGKSNNNVLGAISTEPTPGDLTQ